MSLRIGAKNPATTSALRKASDERADEKKSLQKQNRDKRTNQAAADAAGLAVADKMGALLTGLEQGLEEISASLSAVETTDSKSPAATEPRQRVEELATEARDTFAAQTPLMRPDAARDAARLVGDRIQAQPGQAALAQGNLTPSSVLNLLQ